MVKKPAKKPVAKTMGGAQLQQALDQLGLNQSSLSRLIKVAPRRVRYWIADERPVPTEVAMLLNLMLDTGTKPEALHA
jgi:plasmid maintenance system antidote protein VapI